MGLLYNEKTFKNKVKIERIPMLQYLFLNFPGKNKIYCRRSRRFSPSVPSPPALSLVIYYSFLKHNAPPLFLSHCLSQLRHRIAGAEFQSVKHIHHKMPALIHEVSAAQFEDKRRCEEVVAMSPEGDMATILAVVVSFDDDWARF